MSDKPYWGVSSIKLFHVRLRGSTESTVEKPSSFWPGMLLCSFIMILFLCSSHAAEIESVIPAYSVAYVVVEDVPSIWDAVKASSSWQALLSSDELESKMQKIKAYMDQVAKLLGVDLRASAGIFGQRVAFVQVYADVEGPILPVIIADVSDSEDVSEAIWKMEQALGSDERYEIQPHACTYLTIPFGLARRKREEFTVRYAFLDGLFVLAPEQDAFEAVVDAYLGEGPSLIHDPKFNRTRAEISTDGQVFAYINLEILWPTIWGTWDPELDEILQLLGAHEIRSVAWTADLLTATRDQEVYIYTGDGRVLLANLFAEPKPLFSPHLIPVSDTDIFFAAHLGDPPAAWGKIKRAIGNVVDEEDYAQMQNGISRFEREVGLSLSDDMLSSLTGEMGFAMPFPEVTKSMEDSGSLLENGLTVFCGVKDREKCTMSIERVLSAADVQFQQMEYKGVTVYQIHAPRDSEVPVGYMFASDLLIFGNLQRLGDIIDQEPPLMASDKFAQISSQFPQQLGLLGYVDLGEMEKLLLRANAKNQSEDDIAHLQAPGSIGGTLIHDREGLKARSMGTPGRSWLETIGSMMNLLIHAPF